MQTAKVDARNRNRKATRLRRQSRIAEEDREDPEGAAERVAQRDNTRMPNEAFGRLRARRIDAFEQGMHERVQENEAKQEGDPGAAPSLDAS